MENVTSRDGTAIAFDRMGGGDPIVLVSGGSVDRMSNAPLAQELMSDFTVLNYDRRGRGPSGDTPPYAIEREVEDIEAMLEAAGGSAHLYGTSSGAALALRPRRRGPVLCHPVRDRRLARRSAQARGEVVTGGGGAVNARGRRRPVIRPRSRCGPP